jgi:NADPH:quinone reductase
LILTGAAIRFFIAYELAPKVLAEAIAQLTRWINERLLRHAVVARYALDRTSTPKR